MEQIKIYGFHMARIAEVYLSTLSSIMKPHGLERYYTPMLYLHQHSGSITQKQLATALKIDKVTITRVVDYLNEKNLVVRKQALTDRRCQLLEITPKAKKLIPKIETAIEETNNLLFNDFTTSERIAFEKAINQLFKRIDTLPEPDYIVKAFKRSNK